MFEMQKPNCPDCNDSEGLDRRGFIGTGVGLLAAGAIASVPATVRAQPAAAQPAQPARQAKPAEAMIQELYSGMTDEQKRTLVFPWNDARRRGMFNAAFGRKINESYTAAQQDLNQRILRSIASSDEGYTKLTRNGTFDGSNSFGNCGAYIFGSPANGGQYAWVFAGHHITVRCDGNSEANAAFGGPMYYGHSPDGYSSRNCFFYQTRSVLSVFDALNENQRRAAVVVGTPGELEASIRFRAAGEAHPGIAGRDLSADQKRLIESVMRDVLSPYRQEDTDEVMQIVRDNGGMDRIHLAFYRDRGATDTSRWHFWRLEGPGFVWNYRVLPHVHTYVNIAKV
jgi:Protein of unknown function (DUF3500)